MDIKHHLIFALVTLIFTASVFYSMYSSQNLFSPKSNLGKPLSDEVCLSDFYEDKLLCANSYINTDEKYSCCAVNAAAKFTFCQNGFEEPFSKDC